MSQEIINISSPDDGLGDALRNGFNKTNQNFTELYNNKVDKVAGKGLSENDFTDADKSKLDGIEAGAQVNIQSDFGETDPLEPSFILNKPPSLYAAVGYFLHNDLETQTTPISVLTGVETRLTNDTNGAQTDLSQAPYLVSDVWNSEENCFDFTKLSIGDTLDLRVDILLTTTSANQKYKIFLRVGEGSSKEKDLIVTQGQIKTSSTDEQIVGEVGFSIDYQEHIDEITSLYIVSDDDADVKVNGWYTRVIRKGLNVIDITGGGNWGSITGDLSDQTDLQDALDAKLNKVTTSGVERAYIINADGSQGTKATSEFGTTQNYFTFSTNTTLSNSHHNAVIWVTATINITIPSGLRSDFNCTFRTLTGAIATFLTSGTTINAESDGDVQASKTMSFLAQYTTNNYIISGGGLS